MSLVNLAQRIINSAVQMHKQNKLCAVDATVGNGHDTLFLAKLVGDSGHVYGFDIQQQAIDNSRDYLTNQQLDDRVTLIHSGHENLSASLQALGVTECAVIMFNLGYLPRGDKSIVTRSDTSLSAIQQSVNLLSPGGLISILAYPGHPGGAEETGSVRSLINNLSSIEYLSQHSLSTAAKAGTPELFIIEKQCLTKEYDDYTT